MIDCRKLYRLFHYTQSRSPWCFIINYQFQCLMVISEFITGRTRTTCTTLTNSIICSLNYCYCVCDARVFVTTTPYCRFYVSGKYHCTRQPTHFFSVSVRGFHLCYVSNTTMLLLLITTHFCVSLCVLLEILRR